MEMLRKQKRLINPYFKLSWKLKLMYDSMKPFMIKYMFYHKLFLFLNQFPCFMK